MKPIMLSPSSLSLFTECPRCFWLQFVEGNRRPETPFPSLPNGVDKVLKTHFDWYRKQGKLPPELRKHKIDAKLFGDQATMDLWRTYPGYGLRWTEPESGVILRGYVDEILEKDGKLIVLDFKTRGFPVKEDTAEYYRDQMDLYNLLLRKNGRATESFAHLLFFHPEEVDPSGNFLFETELITVKVDVRKAEKMFMDAIKVLSGRKPKPDKGCGFCRWANDYDA